MQNVNTHSPKKKLKTNPPPQLPHLGQLHQHKNPEPKPAKELGHFPNFKGRKVYLQSFKGRKVYPQILKVEKFTPKILKVEKFTPKILKAEKFTPDF